MNDNFELSYNPLGMKLYKDNQDDLNKYSEIAIWCNFNNANIEDKGEYYEVVNLPEPDINQNKIMELRHYLEETDYVVIKIMEGVATKEHYKEILEKRAQVREELSKLLS